MNYLPYRSLKERNNKRVPTLFLLKTFEIQPRQQRAKIPPLRYFIELLIILLTLFLIATPYINQNAERIAIIIDDSFSTFAHTKNGTVISDIKKSASLLLKGYSDIYEVYLASNPHTKVLDINKITPAYSKDNLSQAIQHLTSQKKYERYIVFTDHAVPNTIAPNISIRSFNDYHTSNNVALVGADYNPQSKILTVNCRSFSENSTTVSLDIHDVLSEEKLYVKNILLPAKSTTSHSVSLALNEQQKNYGLFRVQINPYGTEDSIIEDNITLFNGGGNLPVVLVHSDKTIEELGLNKIPNYIFRLFDNSNISEAQGEIYDNKAPINLNELSLNTLVINPSNDSQQFKGQNNPAAPITYLKLNHPITKYVESYGKIIPPHKTFKINTSAYSILRSSYGDVVWGTTSNQESSNEDVNSGEGNIAIVAGLKLLPFEGKTEPTSSILLLNMLNFAFGDDLKQTSRTIRRSIIDNPDTQFITYNGQQIENHQIDLDRFFGFIVSKSSKNDHSDILPITFYSDDESNIWNHKNFQFKMDNENKHIQIQEFDRYTPHAIIVTIIILAMAILTIDALILYVK